MKNYFLLFLLLVTTHTFAQKKKKVNPKDVQIDSLTKASVTFSNKVDELVIANDTLSTQLDSVTAESVKYYGLYTTIKEKVLKHDFDPARLGHIIDSLAAGRDSTFSGLTAASVSLMDTLTALKKENLQMKTLMEGINDEETARNRLVNELKLLKELLDAHILTQAEFEARKTTVLHKWK